MNSALDLASPAAFFVNSSPASSSNGKIRCGIGFNGSKSVTRLLAISVNGAASRAVLRADSGSSNGIHQQQKVPESRFRYDKSVPEERIEEPVGLSMTEKEIGNLLRCTSCEAKGGVLCTTCSGSGLYLDSIMESQGIIVKIRCLGCGGTGNIMCTDCGGRGHLGLR